MNEMPVTPMPEEPKKSNTGSHHWQSLSLYCSVAAVS